MHLYGAITNLIGASKLLKIKCFYLSCCKITIIFNGIVLAYGSALNDPERSKQITINFIGVNNVSNGFKPN